MVDFTWPFESHQRAVLLQALLASARLPAAVRVHVRPASFHLASAQGRASVYLHQDEVTVSVDRWSILDTRYVQLEWCNPGLFDQLTALLGIYVYDNTR